MIKLNIRHLDQHGQEVISVIDTVQPDGDKVIAGIRENGGFRTWSREGFFPWHSIIHIEIISDGKPSYDDRRDREVFPQ